MKHIKKLGVIILAFLITTIAPVMAQAPIVTVPPKVLSVQETISFYAKLYGANEQELLKVANCESRFNQKALGDNGAALGIYQYHEPTFNSFSHLMGKTLEYSSFQDQAELTSWIWVNYPQYKRSWTCYTMLHFDKK